MTWLEVHHHHHRHHHYHQCCTCGFQIFPVNLLIGSESDHPSPRCTALMCSSHLSYSGEHSLRALYSNRNSSSEIKLLDFICKASQKKRRNLFLSLTGHWAGLDLERKISICCWNVADSVSREANFPKISTSTFSGQGCQYILTGHF